MFNRHVVALSGKPSRLLRAEADLSQQPVHMRDVIADPELALDQSRHSRQRPQLVVPPEGARSSDQVPRESLQLPLRQARFASRLRLRVQPALASTIKSLLPSHHRRRSAANLLRHSAHRQTLLPQKDSGSTPHLKGLLRTDWSHSIYRSDVITRCKFLIRFPPRRSITAWN